MFFGYTCLLAMVGFREELNHHQDISQYLTYFFFPRCKSHADLHISGPSKPGIVILKQLPFEFFIQGSIFGIKEGFL